MNNQLTVRQLDPNIAVFLYKGVRECVKNAIKHGGADRMLVSLCHSEQYIEVAVEDNGTGFTPDEDHFGLKKDSGFGLFNLKNRAEQFDGSITLAKAEKLGGGKVTVYVPHKKLEGMT